MAFTEDISSLANSIGSAASLFTQTKGDMPRSTNVPSAIMEAGLLSPTSNAGDCFVRQQFSNKLQAFLCGYVNSTMSYYAIYK